MDENSTGTELQTDRRKGIPDEQRLMEALLKDYLKYSRPVVNASYSVQISFGFTLIQISDMVSSVRCGCVLFVLF